MWFNQWSPFFDMEKTLEEMDRILDNVGGPQRLPLGDEGGTIRRSC